MAEIIQDEKGKKGGKRRPKKHSTRIDMTPMVDLMCLLITFFMLTTAFSKPKVMIITMPEKNPKDKPQDQPKISADRTMNVLLTGDDKVYWYNGLIEPKKPLPVLTKTDFSKDGIRKVLLSRNKICSQKSQITGAFALQGNYWWRIQRLIMRSKGSRGKIKKAPSSL